VSDHQTRAAAGPLDAEGLRARVDRALAELLDRELAALDFLGDDAAPVVESLSRFVLGAGASRLVRIPPGVAHGVRNIGSTTARLIYFVDEHFTTDPATCDEGRLPWDYLGRDVWEITRG